MMIIITMYPGPNGLVMSSSNLSILLLTEPGNQRSCMDLALSEERLCVLSDQDDRLVTLSLQLRLPVRNLASSGGISLEATGSEFACQSLTATWWWAKAIRKKIATSTKSTSAVIIGACVLKLSSIFFLEGK